MVPCNAMSVAEQTFQDVAAATQDTFNYGDNNIGDYDMMAEAPVPLWRRRWVLLAALALALALALWYWRRRSAAAPKPKEEPPAVKTA